VQLADWICREGQVISEQFLRVDGFLNHRIDPPFIEHAGRLIAERFLDSAVTLVLTAEAAGNVVAYEIARRLRARAVYAKKGRASTMSHPVTRRIFSPTKGEVVELSVCKDYLGDSERVLVIDDFLYQGTTSAALADMVQETGSRVVGFAFIIEKGFAGGREKLAAYDVPVESLLCVEEMDPHTGKITFSLAATGAAGEP